MLKKLVSQSWLRDHLYEEKVRICDCRFELGNSTAGRQAYLKDHIVNAVYFDLEEDLSGTKQTNGGRHPLPEIDNFVEKLQTAGIDETVKVVVYDDQGGAMAARLWWLLNYIGHTNCYILNGGYSSWKAKGFEIGSEVPVYDKTNFETSVNNELLCSMEEVKKAITNKSATLIDSRDELRYFGIEEPIDKRAGHIPTAVNYFWKQLLDESGEWKLTEELERQFDQLDRHSQIIVYCGSGVTACPNVFALQSLGFQHVKLYLGSWSDWISYSENEIVTK